jgi:hypothetical protein
VGGSGGPYVMASSSQGCGGGIYADATSRVVTNIPVTATATNTMVESQRLTSDLHAEFLSMQDMLVSDQVFSKTK